MVTMGHSITGLLSASCAAVEGAGPGPCGTPAFLPAVRGRVRIRPESARLAKGASKNARRRVSISLHFWFCRLPAARARLLRRVSSLPPSLSFRRQRRSSVLFHVGMVCWYMSLWLLCPGAPVPRSPKDRMTGSYYTQQTALIRLHLFDDDSDGSPSSALERVESRAEGVDLRAVPLLVLVLVLDVGVLLAHQPHRSLY